MRRMPSDFVGSFLTNIAARAGGQKGTLLSRQHARMRTGKTYPTIPLENLRKKAPR